jgi:hypothetical protein
VQRKAVKSKGKKSDRDYYNKKQQKVEKIKRNSKLTI